MRSRFPEPAEGSDAYGVETDARGNTLVDGRTNGDLGSVNPDRTGFLVKYDSTGDRVWAPQFGPVPANLAVEATANAYPSASGAGTVHLLKLVLVACSRRRFSSSCPQACTARAQPVPGRVIC